MKRYLLILVILVLAFLLFPNIHILAQEENQDDSCEEKNINLEENDSTSDETSDINNSTIENQIIIGGGAYDHESTICLNELGKQTAIEVYGNAYFLDYLFKFMENTSDRNSITEN